MVWVVRWRRWVLAFVSTAGAVLNGCVVNPNTGQEQLILVSDGEFEALALDAWNQLRAKMPSSHDREVQQRVRRVGREIVRVSGLSRKDWEFHVFDIGDPNAFALPGKIGVFTGILEVIDNDAQLAAVLGHEVGHVVGRHGQEQMSRDLLTGLGVGVVAAILQRSDTENADLMAKVLGLGVTLGVTLPFSREQESQADALGMEYMAKAGYDPREAVQVWRNMTRAGGPRLPEFLSTHPAPDSRIQQLQDLAPRWYPTYLAAIGQGDEFYTASARQFALEATKVGEVTSWHTPTSGNRGSVTPTRTYQTAAGQYCREFQQTVTVGGRTESAYGAACRQPDGTWQILSQ